MREPRGSLLVAACTVVLGVAGCGGGSEGETQAGTTLSGAEYVERADELCSAFATEVGELNAQEKLQEIFTAGGSNEERLNEAADVFEDQLRLIADFRADFEELGVPSVGREDVEKFLQQTRAAEDELRTAVDALRDGEEDAAVSALQRYLAASLESAATARDSELDFTVCGAGA